MDAKTDDPLHTPIRSLLRRLADVHVPRGDTLTFFLCGAVALLGLLNEAITGVLLALYYRPTVSDANASVRYVITEVEYGGLIRSLHYWGAQGLVLVLGAALAFAMVRRSYRPPHSINWTLAATLTLTLVAETVTGGLLPWTRRSLVESQISSTLAGQVPIIGRWLRATMLGGGSTGDLALVRILGVHAGALPILVTACCFALILHAAATIPREPKGPTLPLAPNVALRMAIAAAVGEMALITCASLRSPWLGGAATFDRTAGDDVKPRWFLVFVHDLLRSAPPRMIGIPSTTVISTVLFLFALFVALFPLVDRKASRVGQVAGLVVMAAIAGGTFRALLP